MVICSVSCVGVRCVVSAVYCVLCAVHIGAVVHVSECVIVCGALWCGMQAQRVDFMSSGDGVCGDNEYEYSGPRDATMKGSCQGLELQVLEDPGAPRPVVLGVEKLQWQGCR